MSFLAKKCKTLSIDFLKDKKNPSEHGSIRVKIKFSVIRLEVIVLDSRTLLHGI
jgi:hypothetical protein